MLYTDPLTLDRVSIYILHLGFTPTLPLTPLAVYRRSETGSGYMHIIHTTDYTLYIDTI